MDNVTRFAAVNAKIKAMEGSFLKDEDYKNLLEMESVIDIARYMKEKTAYSETLASVQVENIHRGMLENLIRQNMVRNIDKIIHYFTGDYRDFIKTLYAKYEIEELKVIARAVYNGKGAEEFRSSAFVGKYSGIDQNRIFEAKSIGDIIYALKGSDFYKYLEPLVDGNYTENPFRFEMVMDMAYYSILQKQWNTLSPRDKKILEHAQGIIADKLNLQWIYRGIKFYRLSPEELLNYTIGISYRINFKQLKELCYSQDLEEFFRIARSTKYGFLFKEDETTDIYMERRLERHTFFALKTLIKENNLSIISAFSFIIFLELEVKDIISIVEAVRYKVPAEQAHKYIVRNL